VHNVNDSALRRRALTFGTYAVRNVNDDTHGSDALTKCTGNRTHLPQCRS
jgi:hypothetical protein